MIELSENLRVTDYDANQYTIERKIIVETGDNAGKILWTPVAYCGSVKTLPDVARRVWVGDMVAEAHRAGNAAFDASGLPDLLAALPPKSGKVKKTA